MSLQAPLESYQALLPTEEVSADIQWFLGWLAAELRAEFPELA